MIKTLRAVEKAYDDAAPFYDIMNRIYFRGHDQQFRSMLVNALELSPESIILDMCCGTGLDYPFLRQAINQSGTIIGIDLSKQMLRRAQSKGYRDLHLIRGDITQLPFRDHVFDACIITFCLHVTPYARARLS
jgi:demethylmenaquinone methyltransferase/2-methoxy-6-polyprenyl-1,4-benzoquinol methylase